MKEEPDVRRRYKSGLKNFLELYWPLADAVTVLDNSGEIPKLVALGNSRTAVAADQRLFEEFENCAGTTFKGAMQ